MDVVLQLDHAAREWIVGHRAAWLDPVMSTLSAVGRAGLVFLAIAAIVSFRRRKPRAFVQVALAVSLAGVVTDQVLKPVVERERPFVSAPAVRLLGAAPEDPSFPSGHAATSAAGATTLTFVAPRAAPIWWALAIAIAYSRVYVGVHWPADVLGGIIVGLIAAVVIAIVRRWLLET